MTPSSLNLCLACAFLLLQLADQMVQTTSSQGNWWDVALFSWHGMQRDEPIPGSPESRYAMPVSMCYRVRGLSATQSQLCRENFDHMPIISIGARIGITECRKQFRYRSWNCTSDSESSLFGPIAERATREAGFAHAVATAGVVHALSRACKEARLSSCSCSQAPRPDHLHRDWQWGGCGDNLVYAYHFAADFIDAKEKEKSYPRGSMELAQSLMNLHNNNAGRNAVFKHASVACKCHGVSGSCSLRTCWKQLVPFSQVGNEIVKSYESSVQVKFNRRGTRLRRAKRHLRRPKEKDLIFLEETPNFCDLNHLPAFTVSGRECKIEGNSSESCNVLCCNRQFYSVEKEITQKCNCKFYWCCRVECESCIYRKKIYYCK